MLDPQTGPLMRSMVSQASDPTVVLETVLKQVDDKQSKLLATAMYLEFVTATLQANLKFIQGMRSALAGKAVKSSDA